MAETSDIEISAESDPELKSRVRNHWEAEACGTRYGRESDRRRYFREITETRYQLEPYIPQFADFDGASGKSVLEIGVGAGTDFEQWCVNGANATGVDLTAKGIDLTAERLSLLGTPLGQYTLRVADAEALPFADESFDIVYSYGVLHHSPDTEKAFREAWRVLKPGGVLKAMIYHTPSWTVAMLWLRHGLLKGKPLLSPREVVSRQLESPGTKVYTTRQAEKMLRGIGAPSPRCWTVLGPGDLLTIKPSKRYQHPLYRLVWRLYPRWLVRLMGPGLGLCLLISVTKSTESNAVGTAT